jgi:hypothetical protein
MSLVGNDCSGPCFVVDLAKDPAPRGIFSKIYYLLRHLLSSTLEAKPPHVAISQPIMPVLHFPQGLTRVLDLPSGHAILKECWQSIFAHGNTKFRPSSIF